MSLKVGDKVIVKRGQSSIEEKGTIIEIRYYKDVKGIGSNLKDDVYFYAVMDDREVGIGAGWSYNIFSFDKIWLDTERTREEKLNNILK